MLSDNDMELFFHPPAARVKDTVVFGVAADESM